MITWVEKYFSDRNENRTNVDEIHLWLEQLPGEVKHFSMIPLGTLVVVVAGYESEAIQYIPGEEEEKAIENFMESFVDD